MAEGEDFARSQAELRAELVAKAAALVPFLRAQAPRAEEARRLPEETLAALDEAGLFRLRTPGAYGGYEADVRTYLDVVAELGRGCSSAAWITFISCATVWVVCGFPEAVQREIFAANPDTRFIGVLAPTATSKKVDDGYIVRGKWAYASGCLHAHWALLATPLQKADDTFEPGIVLAPMTDLSIDDTWYFAACRGTGSNTVVADDIFVPARFAMPLSTLLARNALGDATQPITYREAFAASATIMVAAPVLGMARAALELTVERVNAGSKRIAYSTYGDIRQSPGMQFELAEAASLIGAANTLVTSWCDRIAAGARNGQELPFAERARMRVDLGLAMRHCRDGVDRLLSVQGASAFADANPMQRIWRDIEFASRHGLLAAEVPLEILGRALMDDFPMLSPMV